MPISRVFQNTILMENQTIELDAQSSHHLMRVLRAHLHEEVIVFNGSGGEYLGEIICLDKKTVHVKLQKFNSREAESPLKITLAQGISRGEKMDYTIQKAVELGVTRIIPLLTERCNVKLDNERREKRFQHWQSIVISACEQSGRNTIPEIVPPQQLNKWLPTVQTEQGFVLSPTGNMQLRELKTPILTDATLLIGPEGGLSDLEIELAIQHQFMSLILGPRVLRTETAAVAAITALQCCFGDM